LENLLFFVAAVCDPVAFLKIHAVSALTERRYNYCFAEVSQTVLSRLGVDDGFESSVGEKETRPDTTPASIQHLSFLGRRSLLSAANKDRVTWFRFLACHQSWGQGVNQILKVLGAVFLFADAPKH